MDDFKENIPLISALFNPGLRERHWEKMSEIAEQDLTPTEVQYKNMNPGDGGRDAGITGM